MVYVLLDEGVPPSLRHSLIKAGHTTKSAKYAGLTGDSAEFSGLDTKQKDQLLVEAANALGYRAIVTTDTTMQADLDSINATCPVNVIVMRYGEQQKQTPALTASMIPGIISELDQIGSSPERQKNPGFCSVFADPSKGTVKADDGEQRPPGKDDKPDPPEPTKPGGQKRPEAPPPSEKDRPALTALEAEKARLRQQYHGTTEPQRAPEASQAQPSALEAEKARIRQEMMEQERLRREAERSGRGGTGD